MKSRNQREGLYCGRAWGPKLRWIEKEEDGTGCPDELSTPYKRGHWRSHNSAYHLRQPFEAKGKSWMNSDEIEDAFYPF